jgi:ATP-dependent exoDNAse (exonuclease V) alpha subunit
LETSNLQPSTSCPASPGSHGGLSLIQRVKDICPDITVTSEFETALTRMDEGVVPLYLTGRAGTGKSTLLGAYRDALGRNLAVVAPTGVAAINVGGVTIHSFFRFPPTPISSQDIKKLRDSSLYRSLNTLIIDEISMVRADMLDGIDRFLRKNGPNGRLPFGGVRVIMVGDLFQLPPVVATGPEQAFLRDRYRSPFFFSAQVLQATGAEIHELLHVFRQTDANFVRLLNAIRSNNIDREDLAELNSRYLPDFEPPHDEAWIALTGTNRAADAINRRRIQRLRTREFTYEGEPSGRFERINERNYPAPMGLKLREGTQVMFVRNDPDGRWVNGTMGVVKTLEPDEIEVEIGGPGGPSELVGPETWEMYEYVFDEEEKKIEAEVAGEYRQYPLRPAYAITIHKSQGKTFERAVVDLGRGAFAHGQAYVALSRLVDLKGLVLRRPLRRSDLIIDDDVLRFMRQQS